MYSVWPWNYWWSCFPKEAHWWASFFGSLCTNWSLVTKNKSFLSVRLLELTNLLSRRCEKVHWLFNCRKMPVEVQKNPWKAALGGGDRLRDGNGYRMRAVGVCLRGEQQAIALFCIGFLKKELSARGFLGSSLVARTWSRTSRPWLVLFLNRARCPDSYEFSLLEMVITTKTLENLYNFPPRHTIRFRWRWKSRNTPCQLRCWQQWLVCPRRRCGTWRNPRRRSRSWTNGGSRSYRTSYTFCWNYHGILLNVAIWKIVLGRHKAAPFFNIRNGRLGRTSCLGRRTLWPPEGMVPCVESRGTAPRETSEGFETGTFSRW